MPLLGRFNCTLQVWESRFYTIPVSLCSWEYRFPFFICIWISLSIFLYDSPYFLSFPYGENCQSSFLFIFLSPGPPPPTSTKYISSFNCITSHLTITLHHKHTYDTCMYECFHVEYHMDKNDALYICVGYMLLILNS